MKPFLPPNRQGIALDLIVVVCNLILFPIVSDRIDALFGAFFGNDARAGQTLPLLMIVVLGGRLVGLYLKRFPLQARLSQSQDASFPVVFFVFSFPLIVLTAAFVMISLTQAAGSIGIVDVGTDGSPRESQSIQIIGSLAILFLAVLEAYLIYRLSRPLTPDERIRQSKGHWQFRFPAEFAADFGLFVYMIVWQVFYYQVAELLTTRADGAPLAADMKVVSLFFVAICFLLFYLAPRAVFLIEDRKYAGTWLMIGLVFLSSLRNLL
ncbi:MAG: hypothetical protein IPM25_17795 [Chloracidobacterium sp.]|nr:hypothetical protein [Chloracidobacterium sp.]